MAYKDYIDSLDAEYRRGSIFSPLGGALKSAPIEQFATDPWEAFAMSLAKSFVGQGLDTYGELSAQDYRKDAGDAFKTILGGGLYEGPLEGDELDKIRSAVTVFKADRQQELDDLRAQLGLKADYEGLAAQRTEEGKAKAFMKLLGEGGEGGTLSDIDPNSAAAITEIGGKAVDRQRQARQEQTGVEESSRNFLKTPGDRVTETEEYFNLLLQGVDMDTPAGDLAITNGLVKILDPTGVIREGEIKNVQQAQSALQQFLGSSKSFFDGSGRLLPGVRDELLQIAATTRNKRLAGYEDLVSQEELRVKAKGADPNLITRVRANPFDYNEYQQGKGQKAEQKAQVDAATAELMRKHDGDIVKVKSELITMFPNFWDKGK